MLHLAARGAAGGSPVGVVAEFPTALWLTLSDLLVGKGEEEDGDVPATVMAAVVLVLLFIRSAASPLPPSSPRPLPPVAAAAVGGGTVVVAAVGAVLAACAEYPS